jgi:hypothetical protein
LEAIGLEDVGVIFERQAGLGPAVIPRPFADYFSVPYCFLALQPMDDLEAFLLQMVSPLAEKEILFV